MIIAAGIFFVVAPLQRLVAQAPNDIPALNAKIQKLYGEGKFAEATPLAERMLALAETRFGRDNPNVAVALNTLGELFRRQRRYNEAEPLLMRSAALLESVPGRELASSLNNLALLREDQGRPDEAEPLYRRAVYVAEHAVGVDAQFAITMLSHLGGYYISMGRYAEAKPLYERALTYAEKAFGPNHLEVADLLHGLANVFREQGKYAQAEPLYNRSLAVLEKTLGPNHPKVGEVLDNLALLYKEQGRNTQAERLHKRAIAITNAGDSLERARSILEQLRAAGQYLRALPYAESALQLTIRKYGEMHSNTAEAYYNLADLTHYIGEAKKAIGYYEKALAIESQQAVPHIQMIARTKAAMGDALRLDEQWARAEQTLTQAITLYKESLKSDKKGLAVAMNNLAIVYKEQRRVHDAERAYEESLQAWEELSGPNSANLLTVLCNLARLKDQFRREEGEAERLFLRAIAIGRQKAPQNHHHVVCLYSYAEHLIGRDKLDEADAILREAYEPAKSTSPEMVDLITKSRNRIAEFRGNKANPPQVLAKQRRKCQGEIW
jgi:tetratricopeptide (TPR) repeat protein